MRHLALVALAVAAAHAAACAGPPDVGEWGRLRHFGQVTGETPLDIVPPTADRQGNLYVLWGNIDSLQTEAWVGRAAGGWTRVCTDQTKGTDFGVHGWVGHAEARAWYWSGDALVELAPPSGCRRLLDFDPSSGASLQFRAIIPRVRETPSRTTTVALVQSPSDPRPFQVLVDLDNEVYGETTGFEPDDARDVEVLGTGANHADGEGVVVVRYRRGDSVRTEARFYDDFATLVDSVSLGGLDEEVPYGIAGYLQASDEGLWAGVLSTGQVLVFDKSGGRVRNASGMNAVGVHRYEGKLWLVGESDGRPRVAAIDDDGGIDGAQSWDASRAAAAALDGTIEVADDRSLPSRTRTWKSPRNAIGPAPFVSAHSPDPYADGTTLWAIGGPIFDSGGEPRTAAAVGAVGIAYP
jgi:hypothetical protein